MGSWKEALAAAINNEAFDRIVVWGPAGCGKTTICNTLASGTNVGVHDATATPPNTPRHIVMYTTHERPITAADAWIEATAEN